jgi:hypothetical protein
VRLRSIGLPKTRRFCTSKAELKRTFGEIEPLSIHMGDLGSTFKFDGRCHQRPRLGGPVVASLNVSRDMTAMLQLYAVPVNVYGSPAVEDFKQQVLPSLRSWLVSQLRRPQTAVLGYEQRIVEWTGTEHREHDIRYL